jgi:hypothetical protein
MWRSAILAGLFLALLGCDPNDPVFDVRVSMINEGGPVQADLITINRQTGEAFIPEDVVVASFTNKSKSTSVLNDPVTFANSFELKSYTVTWRRADGGPTSGTGWDLASLGFTGATSAVVPPGTTTDVGVLIAPASMKTREPFLTALATGEGIMLIADFDFVGSKAVTSDEEIHVYASLSVNFANFEDE